MLLPLEQHGGQGLQTPAVEHPPISYGQPSNCSRGSLCRACGSEVFPLEQNLHVSGPTPIRPVLFRGHLSRNSDLVAILLSSLWCTSPLCLLLGLRVPSCLSSPSPLMSDPVTCWSCSLSPEAASEPSLMPAGPSFSSPLTGSAAPKILVWPPVLECPTG